MLLLLASVFLIVPSLTLLLSRFSFPISLPIVLSTYITMYSYGDKTPALAIRRRYPLRSTRVSQDSTRVSGPFQTHALNAQVQKDRFLTFF